MALCAACGKDAASQCASCRALVCEACAQTGRCHAHIEARAGHPNPFAHGLLTVLFAAANLSFTVGLEQDPAWMALLLVLLGGTLVAAVAAARDALRQGETFSFLVCLTAGLQVMRATQRGPEGLALLGAFVPFALALHVSQRRGGGWFRMARYLALMVVPALASRMLLAGQAPLAAAWVLIAVALAV